MNAPLDAGLAAALATLGLRPDADARAVRRAYALQLKQIDQGTQLEAFQALREAYEFSLAGIARRDAQAAQAEPTAAGDTAAAAPAEPVAPAPTPGPTPAPDAPPPEPALPPGAALADSVFQPFAARAAAGFTDEDDATAALAQALADERLLNLDARTIFEWQVAHLIMAGWRPGHEFLFGPACQAFGWEQDRAHLRIFGQLGAALDAAINEKLVFFQQSSTAFELQRQAIRRLRATEMPPVALRQADLPLVHLLVQRYPNWLRLITSQENINSWFRDLPEPAPSTTPSPLDVALAPPPERRSPLPWLLFILVVVVVIAGFSAQRSLRPARGDPLPPWAGTASPAPATAQPFPPSVLGPGSPDLGLDPPKSTPAPLYPGLSSPPPARPAPADQPVAAGAQYAFLGPVTFSRTPRQITVDEVETASPRGRSTLRPGDELLGCPPMEKRFPVTFALENGACDNVKTVDPSTGIVTYVFSVLRQGGKTTAALVMPPFDRSIPPPSAKAMADALKAASAIAVPAPVRVARPTPEGKVQLGHVTFQQQETAVIVATVSERSPNSFGNLQPGDVIMGCMSGNYHLPITQVHEVRQCVVTNPPPQDASVTPYMFRVLRESRSQAASLTLRSHEAAAVAASSPKFGGTP